MKAPLRVFKWDDDLAIELPQELVDRLALKEGDEIEVVGADDASDKPGSEPGSQ
jgi:antitoxin component of MazEF toxin-antitoxin module